MSVDRRATVHSSRLTRARFRRTVNGTHASAPAVALIFGRSCKAKRLKNGRIRRARLLSNTLRRRFQKYRTRNSPWNLGNYLLAHCERIRGEWLEAIEQNPDISSLAHLKDEEELADHLPEALSEPSEPGKGYAMRSKLRQIHNMFFWCFRWRQGCRLRGSHTRSEHHPEEVVSHNWLDGYARRSPGWTAELEEQRK